MGKIASVKDLKPRPQREVKKTSIAKRLPFLSAENIARRKGREIGIGRAISPQSPMEEKDMQPFMETHRRVAEATIHHLDNNLRFLENQFKGVELYRLTESAVQNSVHCVAEHAFKAAATKALVNTMMRNLDAHKVFADKLLKVRIATEKNDVATLVDELLEFSKFFDTGLWSKINVLSEKIWDKTGFAVGRFTSDFHLQWMRLLQDPFIQSVMGAVAEAAKSLASYKETNAEFIKKREEIERTIGENPVIEKLQKKLSSLYTEHEKALAKCKELTDILTRNRDCPKNATPITEAQVQKARETANELDYKIEQVITQYSAAISVTLAADENASTARLAGHAIQLHVRTVANLFFSCGTFVLNTAAFFAVKQLLVATGQVQQLGSKGKNIAEMHEVKESMGKLSKSSSGVQTAMSNLDKRVSVKIIDKQTGEERIELIWIAFEITSSPKTCTACGENIPEKTTIARPHYPCLPHYPGEPEVIHDGQRTVVAGAYICHACVSESIEKLNEMQNSGEWQYEPEKTYVRKMKQAA